MPVRPLVLVADDETAIQDLVARVITNLGLVALLVGDGAAAVAAVETHQDDIVCAVLDVVMPVMSGADAAQAIQRIAPNLAIVLMSGAVPLNYVDQIARLRLVGRLTKPFELAALRDTIRRAAVTSIALEKAG
jgi:CheY-like chemotaxis protein